jgi:hypothetical protein
MLTAIETPRYVERRIISRGLLESSERRAAVNEWNADEGALQ